MKTSTRRLLLSAALLLPLAAQAANPPEGALTESSLELSYTTGPMPVPNVGPNVVQGGHYECDETHPCDVFMLTVDVGEDFLERYPRAGIRVVSAATPEYADIDLQVADANGKNIALQRDNPPDQPSLSFRPENGLNVYQVQIVPGTPVPDASATVTLVLGKPAEGKGVLNGAFGGALGATLLGLLAVVAWRRRR
jgi:hypothetical protein